VTLLNLAAVKPDYPDYEDKPPPAALPPQPLRRPVGQSEPYPVDALGALVGPAAAGVADIVQLPVAIAAQSALAVSSLAVQGHIDVEMPYSSATSPVSLFLLSVARSGDRKSAADLMLSAAIAIRERELSDEYDVAKADYDDEMAAYDLAKAAAKSGGKKDRGAILAALKSVGAAPSRPRSPTLTATDPTVEGLHKYLEIGQPTFGLFADEGGQFVGGVGMSKENVLRTAAGFSGLWDGAAIKRMRAGDGVKMLHGRRVSLHLMMQEGNAAKWLSDPVLRDQGLFGRLLLAAPPTMAGQRLHRAPDPASRRDVDHFTAAALESLRQPLPIIDQAKGALEPRAVPFDQRAKSMLLGFSDAVEKELGPGGKLEPISSLAAKAITHACRLAAVLAAVENPGLGMIDAPAAERGVVLMEWYLREALRFNDAGCVTMEVARAESVLQWLQQDWPKRTTTAPRMFSLADLYQYGPPSVRDKATATAAVDILVDHGWIIPMEGPQKVNGCQRREAFLLRDA
jgi:hypothetical protein